MSKFVQSLSATGIIKTSGDAGVFCPEHNCDGENGCAFLTIKVKPSTLRRLSGKRVTIVISPATKGTVDDAR